MNGVLRLPQVRWAIVENSGKSHETVVKSSRLLFMFLANEHVSLKAYKYTEATVPDNSIPCHGTPFPDG